MALLEITGYGLLMNDRNLVQTYFANGGKFQDVVRAARRIIQEGHFAVWEQDTGALRVQVWSRLSEALEIHKNNQRPSQQGMIAWIWSSIFGQEEEDVYTANANELIKILHYRDGNPIVSPFVIPALFGPETTLREAITMISKDVQYSDIFNGNGVYRDLLRGKLYALVQQEWDYQSSTLLGGAKGILMRIGALGRKTILDQGLAWLEYIDVVQGHVGVELFSGEVDLINFGRNMLYLTRKKFEEYTVKTTRVNFINLKGCLQLSEEDVHAILKKEWRWIRSVYPDGRKVDLENRMNCRFPIGFEGPADEVFGDATDWVFVQRGSLGYHDPYSEDSE